MAQYLSLAQVETIIKKAHELGPRDHLMVLLAFTHGLRCGEVAALQTADVTDNMLRVSRLKGSLRTEQSLRPSKNPLFDEPAVLAKWLELKQDSPYLFPSRKGNQALDSKSVGRILKECMIVDGIPAPLAHAHALKHACGSLAIRRGVSVEYVRQWLGHKDVKNTIAFYLHISDSEASEKMFGAFSSTGI